MDMRHCSISLMKYAFDEKSANTYLNDSIRSEAVSIIRMFLTVHSSFSERPGNSILNASENSAEMIIKLITTSPRKPRSAGAPGNVWPSWPMPRPT